MRICSDEEGRNLFRPLKPSPETNEQGQTSKQNDLVTGSKPSSELEPDESVKQKLLLPPRIYEYLPREFLNAPLEDIDPFYEGRKTFVVITVERRIFRFDASDVFWLLGPHSPVRRLAISTFTHRLFVLIMAVIDLVSCCLMMTPETGSNNIILLAFTAVYTVEVIVKITARGFVLRPFTYLRDPWNCLDFALAILAYTPVGPNVGGFVILRGLRLLETLTEYAPDMKTIFRAIKESMNTLANAMVFVAFFVLVFALFGSLCFKSILKQKCVANFPKNGSWGGNLSDENWTIFVGNAIVQANWFVRDSMTPVCSNSSGGGACERGYVCLKGYGANPNNDFTSFDTFVWASLSAFQILTQDRWENLYRLVLRAGAPWQILFFIPAIFFGSYYLQALILSTVVATHSNVHRKDQEVKSAKIEMTRERINGKTSCTTQELLKINSGGPSHFHHANPRTSVIEDDWEMNDTSNGAVDKKKKITLRSVFFRVWECCSRWENVSFAVHNTFVVAFFKLCILVDTFSMTLHHHGMSKSLRIRLESANYFFTIALAIEVATKIIASHPRRYFQEKWNIFESLVVTSSVWELSSGRAMIFSLLRSFRLLKLINSTKLPMLTFKWLLEIMEEALTPLINLAIVCAAIVTLFAVLGMHLFGRNYIENIDRFADSKFPRWNFTDFLHSFITVFRAFCGEWMETMRDCMLVGGVTCVPFYFSVIIVGKFLVMNLFLAPLLIAAGSPIFYNWALNVNIAKAAIMLPIRSIRWCKSIRLKLTDRISFETTDTPEVMSLADEEENVRGRSISRNKCCFFPKNTRRNETKLFIISSGCVIIISSLALALEDVHSEKRPSLQLILYILHIILTLIFSFEMIIRWAVLGIRRCFYTLICVVDFIVVVCGLVYLITPLCGYPEIRILKSIRIVRLVRVIQNKKGMDVVINTLTRGFPSVCAALLLCLITWLPFAILGVRLFAGKYFKCSHTNGTKISFEEAPDFDTCLAENYTWQNSNANFDNLGNAYLSLLQVATFKGWIQIMNDAVDSGELNQQPMEEANIYAYLYFVFFVLICSCFTLTGFTAVIFVNYYQQAAEAMLYIKRYTCRYELSEHFARKKINSCKPVKATPRPQRKFQAKIYETVKSKEFEITFILIIVLNTLLLTVELNESFAKASDYINRIFLCAFTVECTLKMLAFRHHYFKDLWNLFDLTVVLLSTFALALQNEVFFETFSLLRVIRIAKIDGLLRRLKCTKNIRVRNLLATSSKFFPALFNIFLLYSVITFIFAVLGMTLFMHVKEKSGLDDMFNFRTFGQSVMVLVQVSTLAGWNEVLDAITNEENCDAEDCGDSTLGTAFLLSYLVITYLIVIMYIPAFCWYQDKMDGDTIEIITDDDFAMFFETWQEFDPDATNYIQYDQLSDFLDALEPPLQIRKPNKFKIIALKIPLCKNDRVFFRDIFSAEAVDIFTRRGRNFYDFHVEVDTDGITTENDHDTKLLSNQLRTVAGSINETKDHKPVRK